MHSTFIRDVLSKENRKIYLFLVYMIISMFFVINITAREEVNGTIFFILKYLFLPSIVIYTIFVLTNKKQTLYCKRKKVDCISFIVFFLISSMGYVSFFNTILPIQLNIENNKVIKKEYFSGYRGIIYAVNLDIEGKEKRFHISEEDFVKIKVGQPYPAKIKKGGLGIVYIANDKI